MKKIITILFTVSCFSSIAQIAGYQGHRFSLGYSANVSPALLSPLANTRVGTNSDPNREFIFNVVGLNATHSFNIEYVIKNNISFGVSAQIMKTGLAYKGTYDLPNNVANTYDTDEINYRPSDDRPMQFRMTNLTAGFKFFGRNPAPFGKYVKLDAVFYNELVTFDPNGFKSTGPYSKKYIHPTDQYVFHTVGLGFSLGKQRIFFDRLIVDWGGRIGFIPGAFLRMIEADEIVDAFYSSFYGTELDVQLRRQAVYRLQGSQLINFHIGIGFLAF